MAPNDFSDELLESMTLSGTQTPVSQQLRDAVLSQTSRTIRNRRRMHHARLAATLVACYVGGIATMSLWSAGPPVDRTASGSTGGAPRNVELFTGPDMRRLVRPEDDQVADGNVRPAAARLTPYERLCRAGDQQLEKHNDIRAAARSYKKALQLASADQRNIAPDHDTWLLMAMKQSNN